jgi:hypothetical protein
MTAQCRKSPDRSSGANPRDRTVADAAVRHVLPAPVGPSWQSSRAPPSGWPPAGHSATRQTARKCLNFPAASGRHALDVQRPRSDIAAQTYAMPVARGRA